MTIHDIRDRLHRGDYTPVRLPIPAVPGKGQWPDKSKSVEWNEQEILRLSEAAKTAKIENLKRRNEAEQKFQTDCETCIQDELHCTKPQAAIVYQKAYDDGHSNGLNEVLTEIESEIEFLSDYLSKA